jgi:hypothetical protein
VALLADAASSQDVEVVDFKNPVETPPAPTKNELPVAAAGLPPAAPPPSPPASNPATTPASNGAPPPVAIKKPVVAPSIPSPAPDADPDNNQ